MTSELARRFDAMGISCRHPDNAAAYTTLGIGGPVAMSISVHTPDTMGMVLRTLKSGAHPHVLLGGGSNIVFPENAPGLVLILNRMRGIFPAEAGGITVRSGETNLELMAWCAAGGLTGLEFLAGIPGSVGGAAAVNAGAFGSSMAEVVTSARILDSQGREAIVDNSYFQFQYRDSIFKRGEMAILEVTLKVRRDAPEKVRNRIRSHFLYRRSHHPDPNLHSAGCFFKNPRGTGSLPAGRLIDAAGLRGLCRDGLEVASRHANFILHHGGAGMRELRRFIDQIIRSVESEKGIRLEREVLFVAPDGRRF